MRWMCFVVLCLASVAKSYTQPVETPKISTIGEVVQVDFYDSTSGFYIFHPVDLPADSMKLVTFVHGYGALNPMIFGKWIEHLVKQDYCVVYPRYQMGLLSPSPFEFVPNTVTAIHDFMDYAKDNLPVRLSEMYMVGHSYGGVIIANIAARYQQYQLPVPQVAFVCEPGTGPFTGGVLESYQEIDEDILMAIIVGANDATVGQDFGRQIYESATNTPQRIFIWQGADANGEERVGATHYEPYSMDERFDNGIYNFTSNKAKRVSRFDQVDKNGYWRIFNTLVMLDEKDAPLVNASLLDKLSDLGTWSDGSPLKPLRITTPVD